MEAQKACKQEKLMKSEIFPNYYQFKYLDKHEEDKNTLRNIILI